MKVAQSCQTLCDPIPVQGILQARTLEWVAFPFSRGSSQPRNRTGVSCIAGGSFTKWAIREAHYVKPNRFTILQLTGSFIIFSTSPRILFVLWLNPSPLFFLLPHSDFVLVPGKKKKQSLFRLEEIHDFSAIVFLRIRDSLSYSPKQLLQFLEILPKAPLHHLLPCSFPSTFSKQLSHLLRREARRSRPSCPNSHFTDSDSCQQTQLPSRASLFHLKIIFKKFQVFTLTM